MGYHRIETFTDQQVGQKLVKIINFGKKKTPESAATPEI
jgi:hypothetical protein